MYVKFLVRMQLYLMALAAAAWWPAIRASKEVPRWTPFQPARVHLFSQHVCTNRAPLICTVRA